MPLEIVKLSKRSRNKWILRDIALEAREGRTFGICGATSSGKSTMLNVIAGIGKPNGGAIKLGGKDLALVKPKERGMTLVTNRKTAGLLTILSGGSSKESSGEKQLSAFENAIGKAGKVLLLDDPFDQMDEHLRERCFEKIRETTHHRNRIVIFASSDFNQIANLADDAAVLSGGYIIQTGPSKKRAWSPW